MDLEYLGNSLPRSAATIVRGGVNEAILKFVDCDRCGEEPVVGRGCIGVWPWFTAGGGKDGGASMAAGGGGSAMVEGCFGQLNGNFHVALRRTLVWMP